MQLSRPTTSILTTLISLHLLHRPHTALAATNLNISSSNFNPFNQIPFLSSFFSTSSNSTKLSPTSNMTTGRLAPVISISHGGGPMPILGDPGHVAIVKSLKTRVPKILKLGTPEQPRAIVLVTAHWSTNVATISSAEKHDLYYDYYGFPPESYKLKYDAPGSPEVAALVESALKESGLDAKKDSTRGWDHGVFIPMLLIEPAATVPIVQLSVLASEDPSTHFKIGQALYKLREQNIAIIGSGFASMHNLGIMFSGKIRKPEFKAVNEEWNKQVTDAVETESPEERCNKFNGWRKWTSSLEMHPKNGAEHFLPLVVCAGAGGEGKAKKYADSFMGLDFWSYYWE